MFVLRQVNRKTIKIFIYHQASGFPLSQHTWGNSHEEHNLTLLKCISSKLVSLLKVPKNSRLKSHRRTENKTNFLNCQSETGSHNISTSELFLFLKTDENLHVLKEGISLLTSMFNVTGLKPTGKDSQWQWWTVSDTQSVLYSHCVTCIHSALLEDMDSAGVGDTSISFISVFEQSSFTVDIYISQLLKHKNIYDFLNGRLRLYNNTTIHKIHLH